MQKAYITALYELMREDPRVCSLLSDSGTDYDLLMARDLPGQCFNFGIAEQLQVAAAAGMAAMGKIPFVYTTGSFLAYRAYEFIRDDVCLQKRNVKLAGMGMGAGLGNWSTLGPTHHATEDIAALRALPGLTLFSASTPLQLRQMVRAAYALEGPVYIRMGMSGEEECFGEDYLFSPGKCSRLLEGEAYTVFSTGTILGEVRRAVERLRAEGLSAGLTDVPSLKPLEPEEVLSAARGRRMVFTVEEHGIAGGLGGLIAELLAEAGNAPPLRRIGLEDRFSRGYGTTRQVRRMNGLDAEGIYQRIKSYVGGSSNDERRSL